MTLTVVSLFDESGNMGRPWAEKGAHVHCFDTQNANKGVEFVGDGLISYHNTDLSFDRSIEQIADTLDPDIIFGFPPCTDLAVSGAGHFAAKRIKDANFQINAVTLARQVEKLGQLTGSPWFAENPVSVLASMWRAPDHRFHPFEYGGYLPVDDVHPRWPGYIAPRDKYRKKTCLWTGNGFIMPPKKSVGDPGKDSAQHKKLGGKSAKTKPIRSETPRGFALAVMEANYDQARTRRVS